MLRHGLKHGAHNLDIFYGTPSAGNPQAQERFEQNRFTVVRQLRYSRDETQRALDIGLFINGLPVFTFELKNSLTKQTVDDAVEQYRRDRNPREKLFEAGRCVAHFAVDESEVRFCTHLRGKASWFLPFNRGWNDGAGNPPNPSGIKTDYLWREVLARESLADILENYIDEAHSSQGGRTSASISAALGKAGEAGEDETFEDRINRVMASRRLLPNASSDPSTGIRRPQSVATTGFRVATARVQGDSGSESEKRNRYGVTGGRGRSATVRTATPSASPKRRTSSSSEYNASTPWTLAMATICRSTFTFCQEPVAPDFLLPASIARRCDSAASMAARRSKGSTTKRALFANSAT